MAKGDDTSRHPNRRVDRDSISVHFPWNGDSRTVRVNDPSQDPDSGYNEDAATYIETGYWGSLDPDKNEHLIPHRERYLKKLAEDEQDY